MRPRNKCTNHGRRMGFLNHILCQSPKNDTDPTLPILFGGWEGIDPMFPADIDIATKREHPIVGLGEVDTDFSVLLLQVVVVLSMCISVVGRLCGMQKSQFTSGTKGYTHGDILILGPFRVEGTV